MDSTKHELVKRLLEEALAIKPAERSQWLYQQMHAPEVQAEVERLLAAAVAGRETAPIAAKHPEASARSRDPKPPERIGSYRIQGEIGRGGMGVVYLATKEEGGTSRRVALKIVKLGASTEEILQRFNIERRLLSSLDNPGIARIIDAGATDDGRPYFVMEYIEGLPVDRYCDAHELSVQERLELFRKVCAVVHYAHQNLIVHRDLKPSNIMVTSTGEVKLLDFGIAKLLRPDLIGIPFATLPEARLMTPEYASPEQVKGEPVGTSSDVYSLGVLLYELLTGRRPYELKARIQAELIRVICEVEPERPSVAITRSCEVTTSDGTTRTLTPEETAKNRGGLPSRLKRDLTGDLDNIVMMALRKVARRRYESAEQMSRDIQSLLEGRPVIATAETSLYVFGKFVKRNKGFVAGVTAVILSLAVGLAGTWWQYRRADEEFRRAEVEFRRAETEFQRAEDTKQAADESIAAMMSSTKDFVTSFANDLRANSGSLAARVALAEVSLRVLDTLKKQGVESNDHQVLRALAIEQLASAKGGIDGASLGNRLGAIQEYQRALAIWRSLEATAPEVRRGALNNLVKQSEIWRNTVDPRSKDEAAALCAQASPLAELPVTPAPEDRQARAEFLRELTDVRSARQEYAQAAASLTESLELRQSLLAEAQRTGNPANIADARRLVFVAVSKRVFLRKTKPLFDAVCTVPLKKDIDDALALANDAIGASANPSAKALRDRRNAQSDLAQWFVEHGTQADWGNAAEIAQRCVDDAERTRSTDDSDMRIIVDLGRYLVVLGTAQAAQQKLELARAAFVRASLTFDEALARNAADTNARAFKQQVTTLLANMKAEKN